MALLTQQFVSLVNYKVSEEGLVITVSNVQGEGGLTLGNGATQMNLWKYALSVSQELL